MAGRIRVLVVDDEPTLRNLWERLLNAQPDLECVGTLASTDGLMDLVAGTGASVVLLDLNLPGLDPIEAIKRLAASAPDCRVVVCSGLSDSETIDAVIGAGAWGFVDKINPPNDTLESIRRVAGGEFVLPPRF